MDDEELPILHSQSHGCKWPGDTRSQGISNQDIDPWEGLTHNNTE